MYVFLSMCTSFSPIPFFHLCDLTDQFDIQSERKNRGGTIDGMVAIRREDGQLMEWQQYGGRMDNRWNGSTTEGGWTIDGMAAIRREDGQ